MKKQVKKYYVNVKNYIEFQIKQDIKKRSFIKIIFYKIKNDSYDRIFFYINK